MCLNGEWQKETDNMVKDPILTIRGLEKSFGDNHVLRGIDLDVMQGD